MLFVLIFIWASPFSIRRRVAMFRGSLFARPRLHWRSIESGSAIAAPPLHSADAVLTCTSILVVKFIEINFIHILLGSGLIRFFTTLYLFEFFSGFIEDGFITGIII